jgi:GNAT superfamily N-acetyltransferase
MVVTGDNAAKQLLRCAPLSTALPQLRDRELEALRFIEGLSEDYPHIQNWYMEKVVPGLREGSRFLLPVYRNHELVAVGIAKNDGTERKICTVRVAPHHFGRGLGVRVFDGLLKWLDDDRPGLTVSGHKLPSFQRIFDWYGFKFTGAEADIYVPGRQELGYNDAILERRHPDLSFPESSHCKLAMASVKSTP